MNSATLVVCLAAASAAALAVPRPVGVRWQRVAVPHPTLARSRALLMGEKQPEQQEQQPEQQLPSRPGEQRTSGGAENEDLYEEFVRGKEYGNQLRERFTKPLISDPGLPYADVLTVISATLLVSVVTIGLGLPLPSWLYPLEGVPQWRAIPYVLPALAHGSMLACCW